MPPPAQKPSYRLFLSGDGGEPLPDGTDPYILALKKHLEESDENAALLFWETTFIPTVCPIPPDSQRKTFETVLLEQIAMYKNFKGQVFWVAGNHDWDEGHEHGLSNRLNQERFVEEHSAAETSITRTAAARDPLRLPFPTRWCCCCWIPNGGCTNTINP